MIDRSRTLALLLASLITLGGCVDGQRRQHNQALRYLNDGDVATAVQTLSGLANNGYAKSQFRLGVLYLHGIGVPSDPSKAAYWFDKAASQDDLSGHYSLARLYMSGIGVAKNPALARRHFKPLADRGFAPAQFQLGLMLDAGIGGERDVPAAEGYIRRAAEQSHPLAMKAMIEAYERGLLGLAKDADLAEYWRDRTKPKYF